MQASLLQQHNANYLLDQRLDGPSSLIILCVQLLVRITHAQKKQCQKPDIHYLLVPKPILWIIVHGQTALMGRGWQSHTIIAPKRGRASCV